MAFPVLGREAGLSCERPSLPAEPLVAAILTHRPAPSCATLSPFHRRSAHHPTLALRLPVTTLDTTASKARNGDKSNAAGRPPVRAVRAMLDLPEDFDAEGLQVGTVLCCGMQCANSTA